LLSKTSTKGYYQSELRLFYSFTNHTTPLEEAAYFFPNPVAVAMEEWIWIVIPLSLFFEKIGKKQR